MKKTAFFLDRDGVLNESEKHPPNTPEELKLIPGVAESVCKLNNRGYLVFVVTNQGGVGLGYMTVDQLNLIHKKLVAIVQAAGGYFDEIVACTHKPNANCRCRKPKPGMIIDLAQRHNIDLATSYLVGDRDVDMLAGKAAGTKTVFIGEKVDAPDSADLVYVSLAQAVSEILAAEN